MVHICERMHQTSKENLHPLRTLLDDSICIQGAGSDDDGDDDDNDDHCDDSDVDEDDDYDQDDQEE